MTPLEAAPVALRSLTMSDRKRRREALMRGVFLATAWVSILITLLIIVSIAREAWSFLTQVEMGALTEKGWFPRRGLFDIRTPLVGTLIVSGIAMVVATPLGLGAAVYLSEYAKPRVRKTIKPVLELLAGIPSVVIGFFAISFITPELLARVRSDVAFFNLAAAGIGVGILTLPLVASVAEDAMRAVPHSLREAAYGLGSRKMTVAARVVFPAAISGVVASLILGLSRAIGETMVVAIAAGATGGSLFSLDILAPGQTMTAAMAALGVGTDQVKGADAAFQSLYFLGALLFVMTFALNVAGDRFVRRIRERY
ncbi:MAG TPA: phosphate ABC transporter permease subunit PstC [Acidimicrobiia bacterium]|nr:phosphate ABC transporter permease subunit PstC [Acidimicrobiia bacterium]